MKNLDYNTENLIQSFLKYGSKDTLSVDDFLKFRQQVVQESLMGVRDREITEREEEIKQEKTIIQEIISTKEETQIQPQEPNIIQQEKPKEVVQQTVVKNTTPSTQPKPYVEKETKPLNLIEDEETDNQEEFNDKIFLEMMRNIED